MRTSSGLPVFEIIRNEDKQNPPSGIVEILGGALVVENLVKSRSEFTTTQNCLL